MSQSAKTFTFAGVSTLNGAVKARFANDALRTKVLVANGHTDIDLIELPNAMVKEDAIAYLLSIDFGNGKQEVQDALAAELVKRAEPAPKEPKVKKEKAVKPTLEGIAAKGKKAKAKKEAVEADPTAEAVAEPAVDNTEVLPVGTAAEEAAPF